MKRYEQKITEVGLNKGTVSTKIKNMIREFKAAEDELQGIQESYNEEDDDDTKAEILEQINEYKKTLEDVEDEIIRKIEDYARKKDVYDANTKRMQDGRKAKLAEKGQVVEQSNNQNHSSQEISAVAASSSNNISQRTEQPIKSEPISVASEDVKVDKPKKSGGWIFAGILTVAAVLIGVNFMRNKE